MKGGFVQQDTTNHSVYRRESSRSVSFTRHPCSGFSLVVSRQINSKNHSFRDFRRLFHDFHVTVSHELASSSIFNLEFSPNGTTLVVVGENGDISLCDAYNQKHIRTIHRAHQNCVNVAKFVDDYRFLTGSDDRTVRLWDLRKSTVPLLTLLGHRGWIKNIERYDENTILTSSFDGTVRVWTLDGSALPIQTSDKSNIVFSDSNTTRMKLMRCVENNTMKMIVSLSCGFVLVIHNFTLYSAPSDLACNFQELGMRCLFGLFGRSQDKICVPDIFVRSRNRLEILQEPDIFGCSVSLQISEDQRYLLTRKMMDDDEEFLSVFDMSEKTQLLQQVKDLVIDGEKSEDSIVYSHPPSPNRLFFLHSHRISTNNRSPWFPNRLLFRVPDSHAATGFIKEVCFSSCNNLICSPYYRGVRVFDFMKGLTQLKSDGSTSELPLWQSLVNTHNDSVLTTRCHPHLPMFASGGMDGRVNFYWPRC